MVHKTCVLYIIIYHIICLHAQQKRISVQAQTCEFEATSLQGEILHFPSSHIWVEDPCRDYICLVNKCNNTVCTGFFLFEVWKCQLTSLRQAWSLIHLSQLHCTELHAFLVICVFPPMFEAFSYCDLKQFSCFGKRSKIITVLWQCWNCEG